jgi:hypothetical protein
MGGEGGMTAELLWNEEIRRRALEEAAQCLEQRAGNKVYRDAWRAGARAIRALKEKPRENLVAPNEQIST